MRCRTVSAACHQEECASTEGCRNCGTEGTQHRRHLTPEWKKVPLRCMLVPKGSHTSCGTRHIALTERVLATPPKTTRIVLPVTPHAKIKRIAFQARGLYKRMIVLPQSRTHIRGNQ